MVIRLICFPSLQVNAVFDSFFVWNRDQNRYERDGVKNTLNEWLAVSRAVRAFLRC